MASTAEHRRELQKIRARLERVENSIADAVARKEKVEGALAEKREKRDEPPTHRDDEITERIQALAIERRQLIAKLQRLRPRRQRLQRWAKRKARKLRNSISPKVVDLGFDRTATRGLTRQPHISGSVGHYTAGPIDHSDDEAFDLWRRYDAYHKSLGWTALGYNIGITRDGTVVRLRGPEYIGAHTANYNTGQVGISVHGTTGDTWTRLQRRGLRKALRKWKLNDKPVIGHREAPGQSTACPGNFLAGYKRKGE